MRYLALVEVVLVKTVVLDVEQLDWRCIDQHDGILRVKKHTRFTVHHNTRSSDKTHTRAHLHERLRANQVIIRSVVYDIQNTSLVG